MTRRALFAHRKFKHNLIIKIVNPGNIDLINHFKDLRDDNIIVDIDYDYGDTYETFNIDIKKYHVGLVMVSKEMLRDYETRNMLYEAHVPVLKIADRSFSSVKDSALILSDNRDLEKVSTTIFDISEQMGFNIEIFNYLSEHQEAKEQVIEHYYNLSTIFQNLLK